MRSSKLALSALAIAFALSGTAYAADTATPAQPAANCRGSSCGRARQASPLQEARRQEDAGSGKGRRIDVDIGNDFRHPLGRQSGLRGSVLPGTRREAR